MSEHLLERPRHLAEIKCLDEEAGVSDLPPAAAAHEAPELLVNRSSLPGRLLLEGAEGPEVSLSGDDLFHGGGAESADQLVLQVCDAHVEAESFQIGPREVGAEAGAFETALELALLGGVTKACQPHVEPLRPEPVQEPSDGLRTTDRHDGDALAVETPTSALSERFEGAAVADPLDEHHRTRILVHVRIFTAC
jgi:hypothetical protein